MKVSKPRELTDSTCSDRQGARWTLFLFPVVSMETEVSSAEVGNHRDRETERSCVNGTGGQSHVFTQVHIQSNEY